LKRFILFACGVFLNVGLWAGTLAFWRLDPLGDGVDLNNAAGTNYHLKCAGRGLLPSFRRPLALVPGWDDLNPALRGARQNDGSVFIDSGQEVFLAATELGTELYAAGRFTVEGWLRRAGESADKESQYLAGTLGTATGWALTLREDGGRTRFHLLTRYGSASSVSESVFTGSDITGDYGWKHVALVSQLTAEKALWELYLNGVKCGSLTTGVSQAQVCISRDFFIGGKPGAKESFKGQLDLWRVSDKPLKPAEFLSVNAPKMVAYWPLDHSVNGGTDCKDRSGAGVHLVTGRDGGVSGADGQALAILPGVRALKQVKSESLRNAGSLRFDGSLGQRSLLKAPGLGAHCDLTNSFTVEGWFKKDGDPADRFWIVAGARDSANGWLLALREDGGRTRFYLVVSDVAKGGRLQFERFFPNADVSGDSAWHHVALVYDHTAAGKGVWQLYLDGVWQSSVVNLGAPDRSHGFPDFTLGGRDSFSNSFVGWLDAWRVTDGPLAAEQLLCALPDNAPRAGQPVFDDARNVQRGLRVDSVKCVGQPFLTLNRAGHWIGLLSAETECENCTARQLVSTASRDQGRSWSSPSVIEAGNVPDAAWVNGLMTPFGRIYAFYGYCGDGFKPAADKPGNSDPWADGFMVYRFSDDDGLNWSKEQYRVPLRATAIDRLNPWEGEQLLFRCAGQPTVWEQEVFFAITKMSGSSGADGEGWTVASDNILSERNPNLVRFRLLPEGEKGIRNSDSDGLQLSHHLTTLSDGAIICVFSDKGYVTQSVSRDLGKSWLKSTPVTFGSGGRKVRSGGMAPKIFRTCEGRYLLCYSNQRADRGSIDAGVSAVFISGGVERDDGSILWSEPELLLYADDGAQLSAVTDMIEQKGRFWFAAVCDNRFSLTEMPAELLASLWTDVPGAALCGKGLLSESLFADGGHRELEIPPGFGEVADGGFSIEMLLLLEQLEYGTVLFGNFDGRRGVKVEALKKSGCVTLRISLFDGDISASWQTDDGVIKLSQIHHVVFICDFAAGLISAVVDGQFCEEAANSKRGWNSLPDGFRPVTSSSRKAKVAGGVKMLRLFNRPLRTVEAAINFHHSKEQ